jgi:nicotinamide mononucleotide transporter
MRYVSKQSFLWLFLGLGLVIQVVTYILMPDNPWSLVSGLLGVCSVVLGAKGNILTFAFGFAQVGTYTYLCCLERFYAEIALNVFYFITMIYGVYVWRKRLKEDDPMQVQTRVLSRRLLPVLAVALLLISILTGWLLQQYTDDSQPYLDAFTTVPALVAQVLMVMAYREQWYLWIFVDFLAVIMWLRAENYCMAAQYFFWCANCIYGFFEWTYSQESTK